MANSQEENVTKSNGITTQPLPASTKVYVHSHHHPEVSVAMRAVTLSNGGHGVNGNGHGQQKHAPIMIYDTSGPYTDPTAATDIRTGLKPLRLDWIRGRGDVEELSGPSYQPAVKNGTAHSTHLPVAQFGPACQNVAYVRNPEAVRPPCDRA